jgi:hypothetical protein
MRVTFRLSAIARIHWYEYASRFAFGGLATALAGVIAKEYGPSIGGLFLAFPAIFPASATLIEQHEKRKKQKAAGTVPYVDERPLHSTLPVPVSAHLDYFHSHV